jgi:hypothetical protein
MHTGVAILFYLIICLSLPGRSQEKFDISKAREFVLPAVKKTFHHKEKIPFSEIVIRDFRFDSTKFGYIRDFGISKIVSPVPVSGYLTEKINYYFRNNLSPATGKKLIIVLKTLWLQENALNLTNIENEKNKIKIESEEGKRTGACIADFEIFSNSGEVFQPLLKVKGNFYYRPYSTGNLWEFLLMPFDSLFDQLVKTDIETTLSKRTSYSLKEIDSGYISRFILPVLTNPVLQKGVFLTFRDFLSNSISYPEFEVKNSKLSDQLYVQTGKGEELLTEYWGYCNGKNYFINAGLNLFKMIRQNNTWDIYGNTYISNLGNMNNFSTVYGDFMIPSYTKKVELRPLQLNMDTGKVY